MKVKLTRQVKALSAKRFEQKKAVLYHRQSFAQLMQKTRSHALLSSLYLTYTAKIGAQSYKTFRRLFGRLTQ